MNVCSQLYVQIRAIYVQHTSQIVLYTYTTYHIRTRTYTHVYARICTYLTSKEPYVGLTGAVCECISNEYVQILTPCWGHRLNVFERICTYLFENTYIYVQYVYVRICNYTCIYVLHVYARIFDRNTVRIFAKNPCTCILSRCCHGCFAFTGAGASLCTFAARLLRQVCRATAQAHADRQIQSYQVCATDQRKLAATCTGVPRTTQLRRR